GRRLVEVLGLGQLRVGLLGGGFVLERQLRDAPLLRHVVAVLVGLEGGLDFLLGDRRALQRLLARQQQHVGLALLERDVLAHVLHIERPQLLLVGLRDRDQLVGVGNDVLGVAGLVAIGLHGIDERLL